METPSRWVLLAAVALSSFSVGLSLVAVGCRAAEAVPASVKGSVGAASAVEVKSAAPQRAASVPASHARASSAAARASSAGLEVARLVVSADVLEREPVAGAALVAGRPVTAFVELKNPSRAGAVVVTFERAGTTVGHVELAVPGPTARYRTWATTRRVSEPGTWHAVVRSSDGRELARAAFDVGAGERDTAPAS